jgi:hypothetical protein
VKLKVQERDNKTVPEEPKIICSGEELHKENAAATWYT